jgi:RecB family endonuclease NucS
MELIELDADDDLEVARTVEPKNFSELAHNQEAHLEELIIRRPNLLNIGGFKVGGANDLEIIAQQPLTESRKRADLFALDQEGALVVIEVKRESRDQRSRNEE